MSRFANLMERLNEPLPGETNASVDTRYAKRHPDFRPQASAGSAPSAPAPAKLKATVPAAPAITAAQAAANAAQQARERHASVMASDAVKGREKQASELLTASCKSSAEHKSASAIIAKLSTCPTDAQLAAVDLHFKTKEIDAIWTRAVATANSESSKIQVHQKSDDVWSRAVAVVNGEPRKLGTDATAEATEIDRIWTRAISAVKTQGASA